VLRLGVNVPVPVPVCRYRTSWAAKPRPDSQKLPWRIQANLSDRDFFTRRTGGREVETEARLGGSRYRLRVRSVIAGSILLLSLEENAFSPPAPPVLPVISEVLETSLQRDSSPKALARLGLATPRQFLQEICGVAAQDVWNL
jgi:hypothetical protein